MKLTKKEAKRLSILKWEFIIANGGNYYAYELPEELRDLLAECGYCHKYDDCKKCPLYLDESINCDHSEHPWKIWVNNSTVENAQAMLDLILKT